MSPLDLVGLTGLMARGPGRPEVVIALIDGPVALGHPDLATGTIREIAGAAAGRCARSGSVACEHGTFVAGILIGRRGSAAPAICPGCTLLVRPIFPEAAPADGGMPRATPGGLAAAIFDCVDAGARAINLSLAMARPSGSEGRELVGALDHAMRNGVIVVAAAGNQGAVGGSAITRHPWVIPVVACGPDGRPDGRSNLGHSIGRNGLGAPGRQITSLSSTGGPVRAGGTSVAAPFVTGAIALLWSSFPAAGAAHLRLAVTRPGGARRSTVVPALLDASATYRELSASFP